MNKLAGNRKTAMGRWAFAGLVCAGLLNGCGYGNWVQIEGGVAATSKKTVDLTLHAENDGQVRAYLVREVGPTETPTAPAASDGGWNAIPPAEQATVFDTVVPQGLAVVAPATDPAPGKKTIYVWFKDGYGNVSDSVSDTIMYGSTGGGEICTTPGYCN